MQSGIKKTKKKEKIDRPHRNIKPFCHVNPNVEVLWDFTSDVNIEKDIFGGFIEATVKVDREGLWIERLDKIKKYIDENNKRPSGVDKNIDIKNDGRWIDTQQKNYKKNEYVMKNKKIRTIWEEFVNDIRYGEYFLLPTMLEIFNINKIEPYLISVPIFRDL